jgi:hypothetical protein
MRRTLQLLPRASHIEALERRALLSLTPAGSEFPVNKHPTPSSRAIR